jgi:hypothetical protein
MSSYIPAEDAMALAWMRAFADGISANPNLYMLTATDAAAITTQVDAYETAWFAANDKSTRTEAQVNIKTQARASAEQICRGYAMNIKQNPGVPDSAKIDIGVRPENDSREPINCPQTSPLVNILGNTPGLQTLRYSDSSTPDSRKKPFGALQIQVFVFIGDAPTVNADDASYYGAFTKNPIPVAFSEDDDGKCASYFTRWIGRKGDHGPWSEAVSMRIAA